MYSLDKVRDELLKGDDDLVAWLNEKVPDGFFLNSVEREVVAQFAEIQRWAAKGPFSQIAREEFAGVADPWLIATAKAKELIVVTLEKYAPQAKRKIQIPNVCKEFSVLHLDTFKMLRALGASFRLHAHASAPERSPRGGGEPGPRGSSLGRR